MPVHEIAPRQVLVKKTGSRHGRQRTILMRFLLTTIVTTTMITTGGFGTFPPNELTNSAAKLIGENFPAEIIQPVNMVLAQAAAPTLVVVERPKKTAPGVAQLVEAMIKPIFIPLTKVPTAEATTIPAEPTLSADITSTTEVQITPTTEIVASATGEISPTVTQATSTPSTGTGTIAPSQTSALAPTWTLPYLPPSTATQTYKPPVKPSDTPKPPSSTPKPTSTPLLSKTPTVLNTLTPSGTPTVPLTPSPTGTPTPTPTGTLTGTPTGTSTITPTGTLTGTPTETPTITPTGTFTETPTETPTETSTPTPTETPVSCAVGYTLIASMAYDPVNALQADWDGTSWITTTIPNWGSNTCNLPTYNNSGADITIMRRIADNTCATFTVPSGGGVIWVSGDDTLGQCPVELYVP